MILWSKSLINDFALLSKYLLNDRFSKLQNDNIDRAISLKTSSVDLFVKRCLIQCNVLSRDDTLLQFLLN